MTGGVCKEQGHIHRALITPDYYEFQHHEGELQPSIRTKIGFGGLASPFGVAAHCSYHCDARVAQKIRSIQICHCLRLPPSFPGSLYSVLNPSKEVASNCRCRSRSLPHLRGHLTARAYDDHALPLCSSSKAINLTFILQSLLVRFSVYN